MTTLTDLRKTGVDRRQCCKLGAFSLDGGTILGNIRLPKIKEWGIIY